jgi:Tol biopolymer transport system component
MPSKKILVIILTILFVILGIFLVYKFFFVGRITPESAPGDSEQTSQLSKTAQAISQEAVLGVVVDGQKVKYYSTGNGNVYQSDFDGSQLTRISSNLLAGLLKVLWSPSKNKVIAFFEKDGLIKKYFYDYQTQKSASLNQNIRDLSWSPTEDKIAYQYYNPQTEENNISIANPDGSQWTNLMQTRMKDLIINWPIPEKLSLMTRPSGLSQSVLYTLDLENGNFEKIIDQTYGLTVLWSPLGNKILFSETDSQGQNLKLKVADLDKQTIYQLNFVTLPEKCVWSQDNRTIFCAVPQNIPVSSVLPDDYYKGIISFSDDFWRINLETERANQILEAEEGFEGSQLFLPTKEDYLLFINKKDGLLYSLKL